MEIFVYRKGADKIEEGFSRDELPNLLADESNVVWVDFLGEKPEQIEQAKDILTNVFKFHYLNVEDCLETRNQPKVEAFPDYVYFIVHGVKPETNSANFVTKELDCFLGKNFVVTFHAERFQSVKAVKRQIRASPFACQRGAAYLLHQILDELVDLYMPVVDDYDFTINELEESIFHFKRSGTTVLEEIMDLRRSVARLKRISARQMDVLYRISKGEFPQIPENILPFYRDVHDHLQRISDLAESYRDLVSGLFDIHFSVTASKTNDVIKFLTIFSAIILPLSLISGIYGMNTKLLDDERDPQNMWFIFGMMVMIALILVFYFWRKGWIFQKSHDESHSKTDEEDKNQQTGTVT